MGYTEINTDIHLHSILVLVPLCVHLLELIVFRYISEYPRIPLTSPHFNCARQIQHYQLTTISQLQVDATENATENRVSKLAYTDTTKRHTNTTVSYHPINHSISFLHSRLNLRKIHLQMLRTLHTRR